MTNVNDDELLGEENKEDDAERLKEARSQVQWQEEREPMNLPGVGPDNSIPYGSYHQGQQQGQGEPALFGQGQFKDGLGPVYAIPSQPLQGGGGPYNYGQQNDEQPPLFGQNQFKGGLGPVYAVPSQPLQPLHGQSQGHGWQQWGHHPHPMMPHCCCRCRMGYRYHSM